MQNLNLITEAVPLTLFGIIYFVGIYTSDRNLNKLNIELSDSTIMELKKKRIIPPFNIQVLLTTFIFTFPIWFYNIFKDSVIFPYLMYLSLGTFISPLLLSSKLAPTGKDLKNPFLYLTKWVTDKFDSGLKNLFFFGICFILSLIPFISAYGNKIREFFFPVVSNENATPYFTEVTTSIFILLIISHIVRLSMLAINSYWFCLLYCLSVSFCWVDYQWLLNDGFFKQSIIKIISMTFLITIFWDLVKDIIIGSLENFNFKQ